MYLELPDGSALYWTAEGEGPPVAFTHGLFGDHRTFDLVARDLAPRWRVIRWDLRGHGRSTRGTKPATFADLVGDLRAVLAVACPERGPILVGHELGGLLSLSLSLEDPAACLGLSLWAADPAPSPITARVNSALIEVARQVSIRPVLLGLDPLWFRASAEGHDPGLAGVIRRTASSLSAVAVSDVIRAAAARPDLRPRLPEVGLPVQVLWGEKDRLVRAGSGKELLHGIPHAEGGPIPEAAHQLHADRPAVVQQHLASWLVRHRRPTGQERDL